VYAPPITWSLTSTAEGIGLDTITAHNIIIYTHTHTHKHSLHTTTV